MSVIRFPNALRDLRPLFQAHADRNLNLLIIRAELAAPDAQFDPSERPWPLELPPPWAWGEAASAFLRTMDRDHQFPPYEEVGGCYPIGEPSPPPWWAVRRILWGDVDAIPKFQQLARDAAACLDRRQPRYGDDSVLIWMDWLVDAALVSPPGELLHASPERWYPDGFDPNEQHHIALPGNVFNRSATTIDALLNRADTKTNHTPAHATAGETSTRPSESSANLSLDAQITAVAFDLQREGKPITVTAIADRIGMNRSQLHRDHPELIEKIKEYAAVAVRLPRGSKDVATGRFEAFERDT